MDSTPPIVHFLIATPRFRYVTISSSSSSRLSQHSHRAEQCPSSQLNFYYSWTSADEDEFWISTLESNKEALKQVAISEGIYNASFAIYPNYAYANATADQLYTAAGAARLRSIRDAIDPTGIMDLTGGFTI